EQLGGATWLGAAGMALAGSVAVIAITIGVFLLRLPLPTAAFLHLLVVVFLARRKGFLAASAVSIVAVTSPLYFLVPPALNWSVEDPVNWLALAAFEYCALVVSRLSNRAVIQTAIAEGRRRELEALYKAGRMVLLMEREPEAAVQLARLIREI